MQIVGCLWLHSPGAMEQDDLPFSNTAVFYCRNILTRWVPGLDDVTWTLTLELVGWGFAVHKPLVSVATS